jgi:predicted DNA-binding transcriptional regulator YafY
MLRIVKNNRECSVNRDANVLPAEMLLEWLMRPRYPVLKSMDPLAKMFIHAMLAGKPMDFIYVGGSHPGIVRRVSISLVFRHEPYGRIYIAGYCHERASNRIFALDLIMVIQAGN